ncbi:MAG: hypothetical protein GWO24_12440, partial [Akkermansiaceae bacterium]|nr:hypothetical protein [Akkermansiaceae bacterium]
LVHDRDTTYTTSTLANYEASGLTGDPQFTSAGQLPASVSRADGVTPDGLSLPGSSPAIDGGAALGDPFTGSIDGPSRPQGGAWDIGAYENVTRENTPGPPDGIYVVQLP